MRVKSSGSLLRIELKQTAHQLNSFCGLTCSQIFFKVVFIALTRQSLLIYDCVSSCHPLDFISIYVGIRYQAFECGTILYLYMLSCL